MDSDSYMDVNDTVQPDNLRGLPETSRPDSGDTCSDPDDRAVRERILRAFEARLDEILRDEDVPEGIPEGILHELEEEPEASFRDPQNDLYSLWSAITAATQEVKLQGRAFTRLRESLELLVEIAPTLEAVRDEVQGVAKTVSEARYEEWEQAEREVAERVREEHLSLLLDMRDRLKRGLEGAERHLKTARERAKPGFFGRILSDAGQDGLVAVEALQTGVRLAFDRLDDEVREMGVTEIDCLGQRFDPACMRAVDVGPSGGDREGLVLEVYRPGYERDGEVLRLAEVKVARSV